MFAMVGSLGGDRKDAEKASMSATQWNVLRVYTPITMRKPAYKSFQVSMCSDTAECG